MSAPLTLVELPDNVITNIVGSPVIAAPVINFPAVDTITTINPATMFVLVYDSAAVGEKLKKISVNDFIESLQLITV